MGERSRKLSQKSGISKLNIGIDFETLRPEVQPEVLDLLASMIVDYIDREARHEGSSDSMGRRIRQDKPR